MIEKLALSIATSIKKVDEDQTPSIEVMKFSLITILHTLFTMVIIIIVGLVLGKPWVTLYGLLYFMLLRFFSGGYHLHSSLWCSVLSVVLMCAAPFISLSNDLIIIGNIVNLVMMAIFAPSNIKGFAQIPEKFFPILKLVSIVIVGANFFMKDPTLTIVAIFQSVLLLFKNGKEVNHS
ncbi:accessory gene regulator B family protein [Cohnella thailandensis]|uniref:Accessory gene regulator B family protein n=1 Tax=Cohnella thailandensis TaxID=557557 RepID=A0A841SUN8_9BACL|nr:accessory gene regulator B family protein [Cohnella thailandensis]MBP1976554.1 accessory gene regulator B [Cohnella thailandensis]